MQHSVIPLRHRCCIVVSHLQVYNGAMVRQLRVILLAAVSVLLFAMVLAGAEIVVSTDGAGAYRSIQRAIDAAHYGDVIVVNPGIYEETLVLASGLTIRGAGPSHTIIRSSYGYQPVVSGSAVGAVVLEGLGLERTLSILASVVVDLQSSQLVIRNCRIAGGQLGGLRSTGLATLVIEECTIENNEGYGLQVSGMADLSVRDSIFADNGSIGLHLHDAAAVVDNTIVEHNDWDGIALEGSASLSCSVVTISSNGHVGLSLLDASHATFVDSVFSTLASGNVSLEDESSLGLSACQITGGIQGCIEAQGRAHLQIKESTITGGLGDGLHLEDAASLDLEQSVVAHSGGNGLSLQTSGTCRVINTTVAYNEGHGLNFLGASIEMTQSIVALNGGIGLNVHVSSGLSPSLRFEYNNVWGNRSGEYAGIHRSSSDISEAPEFVDPERGDWSLLSDSPCIDAGRFGSILGPSADPQPVGGIMLDLVRAQSRWGTVVAGMQWDILSSIGGHLDWRYDQGSADAAITASFSGLRHLRTEGTFAYSPSSPLDMLGGALTPQLGIRGVLDGVASRWQAWGSAQLHVSRSVLRVATSFEGPTAITRQDFHLETGNLSLTAGAIDLTLTDLAIGWANDLAGRHSRVELQLIPDLHLSAQWATNLTATMLQVEGDTYLGQLGTSSLSLLWRDEDGVTASVSLHLREGRFEDAMAQVSAQWANIELSGSLGASLNHGPRGRLGILIDTDAWFSPRINQSPLPAYSYSPFEPEAGEVVTFDASASTDMDGELDQVWWDFGDGVMDIGVKAEHRFEVPGDYTITVMVSDDDGATTTLVEKFTVREAETTPVAAFTWAAVSDGGARLPRPLRAGDRILLDATDSYDPNGAIVEYSWDIESDGVFDQTTDQPRIVAEPLPTGTWPTTLRVVDQEGYSDAVMHVLTIAELKSPEASFEIVPVTPAIADPVRFVDMSLHWDGTILSWEWDFGDGHTSREQEPVHRYQATGVYEATLTVRDSEGLASTVTEAVTVQLNPELVPIAQVWALLIGISDYAQVEDLSYASQDAWEMAAWLLDAGVPSDHIRLLTDEAGMTRAELPNLASEVATLVNVREGLGWLRQQADRDDLVVIHFSGHGYQGADDNGDERDGVDEFFVLHDTRAAAKDDTALRDDEFGRFVDRIESEHVLIFFDSCYSGGLSRSLSPGSRATGQTSDIFSDFRLEGRLVLSASSEQQDAFESPQLEHGVLTHFLLSGLSGAADLNADGHVTIWELFEYAHAEVPRFVLAERGKLQVPQLLGQGETRVVLTRSAATQDLDFSYCPAIPVVGVAVTFRFEGDADGASLFWDFGDGAADTGNVVVHRFPSPGVYPVQLRSQLPNGTESTKRIEIQVSSWATILALSEQGDQAVLSVGSQNGVSLGDRLASATVAAELGSDLEPLIEVIELIDEDSSVGQILQNTDTARVGAMLVPIDEPGKDPCFESP